MTSKLIKLLRYISAIAIVGVLFWLIFQPAFEDNSGFKDRTTWDRIELLGIPIILALGAFYLERSERVAERELAIDRQQDASLQSYIDRMTELLLQYDLRNAPTREVQIVAETLSQSALRSVGIQRKRYVLDFLRDALLIGAIYQGQQISPVLSLAEADFRYADLRGLDLRFVDLKKANLQHADLRGVVTKETNFYEADMRYANMQGANLDWSYFQRTNMSYANLRDAVFWDLTLDNTILQHADLRGADFHHSSGLLNVDLTGANLKGAIVPDGHLTALSLKGAIMPNGKKHK